ncbi:LysR family transcriptional regulator [Salinisphaera orenii]|uniref:LysR family transcriptional regulator n=1 Tax=Salinisphaera orenii TaxID=856731 RepID=UPI000DBE274A
MARSYKNQLSQVSDVDFNLVRVFKTVVECGGFTAAVPVLGVSRSAISTHMANLEARFDLKLCQRGRSGFALTEEGQDVYEASLRLLASIDSFRAEVNNFHQELHGYLNIGITDTLVSLPHMHITHALTALKRRGPKVDINIYMQPPGEVERGVVDGRLQVGVVPAVNKMSALEYMSLYDEVAHLYCSAHHPLFKRSDSTITDEELRACDAVRPTFALPESGRRLHKTLNETASASDREGVAFLILTGLYIGYLPRHFAERWTQQNDLRAIRPSDYSYRIQYATITRRGRLYQRVLETFLAELGELD